MMQRFIAPLAVLLLITIFFYPSAAAVQSNGTLTPVKHVIIITMENHSFDNLFGVYPSLNSSPAGVSGNLTVPVNLLGSKEISKLTAVPPGVYATQDPVEGYTAYHIDWNGGLMNDFRSGSGPQSMTYFTRAQMAPEWDLAEEYSIADMYFSSTLTATMPNRLYELAGFSPIYNDYGPPPYIPYGQTIFAELDHYGISWSYYVRHPSQGTAVTSYIYGMGSHSKDIKSWFDFFDELNRSAIPAVSFFMPIGVGVHGYSQHPSDNMIGGEMWLLYLISAVMKSALWKETAIFINYDEGGGYYDQVAPPLLMHHRLGFRVPLLLISAYSKEDYISGTLLNHASLLAFIDYNWGMPPLNPFVAHSNLPLDMFDFGAVRPPLNLIPLSALIPSSITFNPDSAAMPASIPFPLPPQYAFSSLNYSRTGSTSLNLSDIQPYVKENYSFTPFLESDYVLLGIMAISFAGFYFVATKRK